MKRKTTVLTLCATLLALCLSTQGQSIQDETRWTNALGEAGPVVCEDCNEDIDLCNIAAGGI